MSGVAEVVERYFDAWTSKDFGTARSLLQDNLSFTGPLEEFDSADALIESLKMLSQIVTGAERRGLLSDGERVAVVYDLHTVPVGYGPDGSPKVVMDILLFDSMTAQESIAQAMRRTLEGAPAHEGGEEVFAAFVEAMVPRLRTTASEKTTFS